MLEEAGFKGTPAAGFIEYNTLPVTANGYDELIAVVAKEELVALAAYDDEIAVCENDAESTEPVTAPIIAPVTVSDPVIATFPN